MVSNNETKVVWNMALPDGQYLGSGSYTFLPGTDDFFAMLGTPNVRSSVYFLMDHLDQLGKTIEKIVVNGDIVIHFKNI